MSEKKPRAPRNKAPADQSSPTPLPIVNAALLCAMVIPGRDGTNTLARVLDTVYPDNPPGFGIMPGDDNGAPIRHLFPVTYFVTLVSAEVSAALDLVLEFHRPSGKSKEVIRTGLQEFPGVAEALNLIFEMHIEIVEEGVHWISVRTVEGRELVRTPLKVVLKPADTPPDGPTLGGAQ